MTTELQCLGAIYHHDDCVGHHISHHPEKPSRATAILSHLQSIYPEQAYYRKADAVTHEQLLLYHEPQQIDLFLKLCQRAEASGTKFRIDCDTEVMQSTRMAVYRAAGALIGAVDALFLPAEHPLRIQTAFCCTRPPGHHAERHRSMGFCFFNNAAIAAKHAQATYGETLGLKRVAVVDFDVHHGNGTEEGFSDDPTLFYGSTHELGNFPGTGPEPDELCKGDETVEELLAQYLCVTHSDAHHTTTSPKKLNFESESESESERETTLKALTRLLHISTKEGMKAEATALRDNTCSVVVPSTALDSVNQCHYVGPDEFSRRIVNRELRPGRLSRRDFRRGWVDVILEMIRFQPHLVIISAGFDAHLNDPLANCHLTEEDFQWATELVVEACRLCPHTAIQPQGITGCPVLSILEGGYDLEAIAQSAAAHVQVLFRDISPPPSVLPPPPPGEWEERQSESIVVGKGALKSDVATPFPTLYPANLEDFDSSSEEEENSQEATIDAATSMMMESLHMYIGGKQQESADNDNSDKGDGNSKDDQDNEDDRDNSEDDNDDGSTEEVGTEKMSISDILGSLDDSIAKLMLSAVQEGEQGHELELESVSVSVQEDGLDQDGHEQQQEEDQEDQEQDKEESPAS